MANGRNRGQKSDSGRDAGGFAALPWSVLDCPAYSRLSHPGKSLLMEFARQFVRDNNGRLLCSMAYMSGRGWKSWDVLARAKAELLAAGFIYETAKGQRPNKASWYAVTWRALDRIPGYDAGAAELFVRGAYQKNAPLTPSPGAQKPRIAPSPGVEGAVTTPSPGAIGAGFGCFSTPGDGDHLEKPSVGTEASTTTAQQASNETIVQLRSAIRNDGVAAR